jgi:hypothetical protein
MPPSAREFLEDSRNAVAARFDDMTGPSAAHLAPGDAIVRTQAEPGGKMCLGVPAGHLQPGFADDRLGYPDIDAIDLRQVDAGDALELVS